MDIRGRRKKALLDTHVNVMGSSTHLFVAMLIVGFAPQPQALAVWKKSPQLQGLSHSPPKQDGPFQRYPQVKRLLKRLEDKSLAADQCVEVAHEVMEAVEAIDNDVLRLQAYLALMDFSAIRVELELCKDLLSLAAEVDEKVNDPRLTARLQYLGARYQNKIGEFRKTIELIKKAQVSKLLSPQDLSTSNLVLGVACERLGLLEQSYEAFQQALVIDDADNSRANVRLAKSNLGEILVRMKKFERAAAVFDELDPLDTPSYVFVRVTLGRCKIALSKHDTDTAMKLSQTAIESYKVPTRKISEWGNQRKREYMGLLFLMQARCYAMRDEFETAQKFCEKALELLKNKPQEFYAAKAILGGIVANRGNPELGIKMVRDSYEAAKAEKHLYSELTASEKLTQLYEDNGYFKEAIAQYKLTEAFKISMKVGDWELQHELDELQHQAKLKEQRITTEERAKTKQAELVAANAISQADKSKTIQYGTGAAFALTLLGGVAYFVSQSRRKKTQSQLNLARERVEFQEQLAQKKRLEDVGELTESVAHDFNNFLQIICQINFLLEDSLGEQLTNTQEKLFQNEDNAVAVASKITEQLLTYAKRQATAPKVALITMMLESAFALFGADKDSAPVSVSEFDQTLAINVDQQQFSNAILNVLLNAHDSMDGTGVIKFRIAEQAISSPNSLQLRAGDYVCIEISDSGKGMNDEQLRRACEPFFTTKPPTTGTGLGLSSVKGFVEQAGGAIKLASTIGRGATVSLYFPKADAAVDFRQPVKSDFTVATLSERVCLIVEDNPIVRSTLELMLESCGYKSTSCCCADDARDLLKAEHDFSLVLSDIRMPGEWSGIDLAKWIKVTFPEIQVVLISGNDAPSDLERVAFLRKPFLLRDLQSVLEIEPVHQ